MLEIFVARNGDSAFNFDAFYSSRMHSMSKN